MVGPIDPATNRVTRGYGILQPRVSIALASASRSKFVQVFSGYTGIDPYTTAVSDVYQDFFGEGNFTALFQSMERDQMRRGVLQVEETAE